ncbi:uncharacterized protein LOC134811474 [Bolinopsis microptera]|uniref:uncharacterized protein LOC134811474 n=1 Tax=Bolinopsis microptera TaxID=2820187 RepID=UPI003078C7B3
MDSMNEIRKISETPTKVEIVRPRKECMPEKDLMNYLHKLHASNVPDHRRDLLEEMHSNHNLSCKQLSIILSQLRYLAEKDQTVRLFCPHILDPENLPDLVQSLEDDSFQDKTIITSIVNCIADSL